MRGARIPVMLVAVCLISGLSREGLAADRKLVVAVVNQVAWHDLLSDQVNAPVVRKLANEGAVGAMCVRTARGLGGEGGYLTIGAGARASAATWGAAIPSLEGYAFQTTERVPFPMAPWSKGAPAAQVFRANTGWPTGGNRIVHLGIGEMIRQNISASYPIRLGLLGGTLRRAGLRVACVGNADTRGSPHRELVTIAMDEQGLVELGEVSANVLREQRAVAYEFVTDSDAFLAALARVSAVADVIILELGETARAAEYAGKMTPEHARNTRCQAIEKSDRLLGEALAKVLGAGWAVLVVTPAVRRPDPGEEFAALAPVILYQPETPPGMLTSASTRRTGLVVSTDVAATVLEYFGLPRPADTVGRPMVSEAVTGVHLARLQGYLKRQDAAEAARPYLFRWLPIHVAVAMWVTAFLVLLGGRSPLWARAATRGLILVAQAAGSAALVAALRPLSAPHTLAAVAGGSLVIALIGCWLTGWRSANVVPAALLVMLLAYDLIRGQNMVQWSLLSYSAPSGARFYGIGNEYGGALLGASLVLAAAVVSGGSRASWMRRSVVAVGLIGLAVLVGHPRSGANVGMALGCAVGFAVYILYLWRQRPAWGDVVTVVLVVFGVVGCAVVVDIFVKGPEASHIGMLAAAVREQGWPALWQVVVRKLTMNWLLLRVSSWTNAATGALGLLGVVLVARPPIVIAALREQEWLNAAVIACLCGALASVLLNDSGIVAGALALLYGAGSLGYLALGQGERQVRA